MMRQIGRVTGLTIFIALASGCATPSSPGFLSESQLTEIEGCRPGTVEFCPMESGRLRSTSPTAACGCVNRNSLDSGEFDIYQY